MRAKKTGKKSDFKLVFLGHSVYNSRIERAWGGEYPLQLAVLLLFVFGRLLGKRSLPFGFMLLF